MNSLVMAIKSLTQINIPRWGQINLIRCSNAWNDNAKLIWSPFISIHCPRWRKQDLNGKLSLNAMNMTSDFMNMQSIYLMSKGLWWWHMQVTQLLGMVLSEKMKEWSQFELEYYIPCRMFYFISLCIFVSNIKLGFDLRYIYSGTCLNITCFNSSWLELSHYCRCSLCW